MCPIGGILILKISILSLLFLSLLGLIFFHFLVFQCPQLPEKINQIQNQKGSRILSDDGEVLNTNEFPVWLKKKDISPYFFQALIAVEDHNFYHHSGISMSRLVKVIFKDILITLHLKKGNLEGASTLTQQLAKNLFLTPERSLTRKAREMLTAFHLEYRYSKDEIITAYANLVCYGTDQTGRSIYGIEQASLSFFTKHANQLSLNEAACIAGVLKTGSYYNPIRYPDRANRRRQVVLMRMMECDYITPQEYARLKDSTIVIQRRNYLNGSIQYFLDYIKKDFLTRFSWDIYQNGNISINTTLNRHYQTILQEAVQRNLQSIDQKLGFKIPYDSAGRNDLGAYPQVAAVVISVPDGAIRAMVGGRDYFQSQFNRATTAFRQLGSTFKPFHYLMAFNEKVIFPHTQFMDQPVIFIFNSLKWFTQDGFVDTLKNKLPASIATPRSTDNLQEISLIYRSLYDQIRTDTEISSKLRQELALLLNYGKLEYYRPENYSKTYKADWIDVTYALANSINTVSAQILTYYDITKLENFARRLGFQKIPSHSLSLALGTLEGTPCQLAGAYLMLANNGYFHIPYSIHSVIDQNGSSLYQPYYFHLKMMNSFVVYRTRTLMEEVINNGTAQWIRRMGYTQKSAGKTGTSSNFADAWFCGFTPNLVCVVWIGFDNNQPLRYNNKGFAGGELALPIWLDFMKQIVPNELALAFPEIDEADFKIFFQEHNTYQLFKKHADQLHTRPIPVLP